MAVREVGVLLILCCAAQVPHAGELRKFEFPSERMAPYGERMAPYEQQMAPYYVPYEPPPAGSVRDGQTMPPPPEPAGQDDVPSEPWQQKFRQQDQDFEKLLHGWR